MTVAKILKRGFKAQAERLATEYREKINLNPYDPLSAFDLAKFLKVPVYKANECMPNPDDIEILIKQGHSSCWSAVAVITKKGNKVIIHNPYNTPARQQSDLMHELAHFICEHKVEETKYDFEIPFGMRDYNPLQEEEAKCLGAILQLSNVCLKWALKRSMTQEEIAEHFNASKEMVRYRMNMSGLAKRKFSRSAPS